MQRMYRFFWILGLLFISLAAHAAQVEVAAMRFSESQATQVTFDLSHVAHYRLFTLKKPSRLVVDFTDARLANSISPPPEGHPLFVNVRSARRNSSDLRVVVELSSDVEAKANIFSKAGITQLLVDLSVKEGTAAATSRPTGLKNNSADVKVIRTQAPTHGKKAHIRSREIVVAIDAGHGGKDVGAQGGKGTQEKDVVFAIAKRLESLVNKQPGMRAVMTRKGDYFVKLRERVRIARAAKADLFVSIHADAFNDSSARGASVYTLSNKGASSEAARWLADSENASDLVGGVSLDDKDDTLASVLLDLSQTAAKEASQNVGSKVLRHVKSVGHLHRSSVQKAGFVVLKSPDIPSILVETAFISNPEEERRLNTANYQSNMAAAVFQGIMSHFRQYAPANTLFAQRSKSGKMPAQASAASKNKIAPVGDERVLARNSVPPASASSNYKHVINRGETLSGIARQYGVSMRALRTANDMTDGNVKVGQVLRIPHSI